MMKYEEANEGYNYFVLFIDIFTRYVWTSPLKTLQGREMKENMESIFGETHPRKLVTDRGSEFMNKTVQNYLKKEGIIHFTTTNEVKAPHAERAIKTIKSRITRYMDYKQNHKWIEALPKLTRAYNNTIHRIINTTPAKARTESTPFQLWNVQYKPQLPPVINYKFKVGDDVKITYLRRAFDREYNQRWTTETFKISSRDKLQGIPMYTLKDLHEEPIEGKFYEKELQKVEVTDSKLHRIEKIVKSRKRGKQKEYLVHWMGWPSKFDSWVSEKDIKRYNEAETAEGN
jgi:hypothetical protein